MLRADAGRNQARIDVPLGEQTPLRDDVIREPLVRRGIYDRPYLARLGTPSTALAIGGYLDVLGGYAREEGLSDGWSFEARRFNLFVTSRIADTVRLTSELEFEHGTDEIALEVALVDVLLHHTVNLRAGVLLVPLGKFNIAHDSPIYNVVDRPLVSTRIIPATLSEVGFGLFGVLYPQGGHKITYEAYVVNGLGDGVIASEGTRLAAGKDTATFAKDNNGVPAVTGRLAYVSPTSTAWQGELGVSMYAGIYNTFEVEGDAVDDARWLRILALDAELAYGPLTVRGELAYAAVDLAGTPTDLHARQQYGFYAEVDGRIVQGTLGGMADASFGAVARIDHIDLDVDDRRTSAGVVSDIGDETTRLSIGPWFRPASATTLRAIYFHEWLRDTFDNPLRGGGVQVGLATYF